LKNFFGAAMAIGAGRGARISTPGGIAAVLGAGYLICVDLVQNKSHPRKARAGKANFAECERAVIS
jgi:hypothetical protein